MALRDTLCERTQPLLEAGEEIRQIMMVHSGGSPYLGVISGAVVLVAGSYHIIAVTDRSVVVLDAHRLARTRPRALVRRLPRETRLGPVSGIWSKVQLDRQYYVHRRFHKELNAADAELEARTAGAVLAPVAV